MIFVTVGTGKWGFDRLISELDRIAKDLPVGIFAQIGWTKAMPTNFPCERFLTFSEVMRRMASARLIIGHASAGPIVHSRRLGIPLIAVPRRPELGELLDGHQVETGKAIEGLPMIEVVWEMDRLLPAIGMALSAPERLREGRRESGGIRDLLGALRVFTDSVAAAKADKANKGGPAARAARTVTSPGGSGPP